MIDLSSNDIILFDFLQKLMYRKRMCHSSRWWYNPQMFTEFELEKRPYLPFDVPWCRHNAQIMRGITIKIKIEISIAFYSSRARFFWTASPKRIVCSWRETFCAKFVGQEKIYKFIFESLSSYVQSLCKYSIYWFTSRYIGHVKWRSLACSYSAYFEYRRLSGLIFCSALMTCD